MIFARNLAYAVSGLTKKSRVRADTPFMAITVAGTNAVGDHLVSPIHGAGIPFGESAQGARTSPDQSAPLASATRSVSAAPLPPTPAPLPAVAEEQPQHIAASAIQTALLREQPDTISTLFASAGIGTNLSTFA
jgi:hypothetical protein